MQTAIYLLKTFILVLIGKGGAESAALWSAILIFVIGSILIYRDAKLTGQVDETRRERDV